jgi:hypothetical protein
MTFQSIWVQKSDNFVPMERPDFSADLNLDQIAAASAFGTD